MKRTLRSALCVTTACALAGGIFYFSSQKPAVPFRVNVQSLAAPAVEQITAVLAPVEKMAVAAAEQVTEWAAAAPEQKSSTPVVLLSEPVIIIGDGREALPKGTPVRVLKHQGLYVQVLHESRVITIPRTAMVLGAYRPN